MKLGSFFRKVEGTNRVTLTDDRPEWLYDAVYDAHQSDGPNDWIYATCEAVCDAIDDGSLTDDDSVHEFADSQVDTYTRELYQWAADMCLSDTFSAAESDADDCGGLAEDTTTRLMQLQYHAIDRIARIILEAFNQASDETDE